MGSRYSSLSSYYHPWSLLLTCPCPAVMERWAWGRETPSGKEITGLQLKVRLGYRDKVQEEEIWVGHQQHLPLWAAVGKLRRIQLRKPGVVESGVPEGRQR